MNEHEFSEMVNLIRKAETAIGEVDYKLTEKQLKGKEFSRSLYIINDLKEGDIITENDIKSIRPGFGLHPKHYSQIIGRTVNKCFTKGDRISFSDLQ